MSAGVYSILNNVNGKRYVGSSVDIETRMLTHRSKLRTGKHHSSKLQRAWDKYGESAFEFSVSLLCAGDNCFMYEQIFIDFYESAGRRGYNVAPNAGGTRGLVHSEESKRKSSISNTGKKRSAETKARVSVAKRGVPHKPGANAAKIGRKQSAETIEKRVSKLRGKALSDEHKEKLRNYVKTPEHIAKIVSARKERTARLRGDSTCPSQ
jgi:group I intron endonuclease